MNQLRGLLAEAGIVVAQGAITLSRALALILEHRDNEISELMRELLAEMSERLRWLDERLKRDDVRIAEFARADERAGRLMAVEGGGSADRHRADSRSRRRAAVPQRARAECLAGAGAAPALERRGAAYYSGSASAATVICAPC
jgi:hypothetical protein